MRISFVCAVTGLLVALPQFAARSADAEQPSAKPPAPINVELPGNPFGVTMSHDGNWIFVAVSGRSNLGTGIALVRRDHGKYELKRVVPLDDDPTGIALTHDEKCLAVAGWTDVEVLDTGRMISGSGDPVIAHFKTTEGQGSVYVNVSTDDKTMFVSEEHSRAITVVDLDRIRRKGYDAQAIIGKIPVGGGPIALTFSPDGRLLYTTNQSALPAWNLPGADARGGAVLVIDVAKARTDPANSVVARVAAGDDPVRMTISPDGRRIYVTDRSKNSVLSLDAGKLVGDAQHALVASAPVGPAPVPVAVIQGGTKIVVGNSNRFAREAQKSSTLTVIAADRMGQPDAVLGTILAGAFPREMCVSADGKTLAVANFGSDTLEIIDAENPPIDAR